MQRMVELFGPEVKKSGFLTEWSLFVDQKLNIELLANMLMEHLRTTEDAPRMAFTRLLSFMKVRQWPEFLESITGLLEPEELERFQKHGAADRYNTMKLLCSLQVEDYWNQFFVQKQKEAKEILEDLDKLPSVALETKIQIVVKNEVAAQTDAALQKTVDVLKGEIKKLLDEHDSGESWKSEGGV